MPATGKPIPEYPIHHLAKIFPPMSDEEYEALKADIKSQQRVLDPVTLMNGAVIDGRHRYPAAKEAGLNADQIQFQELPAGTDPLAFVVSKNLIGRNLSASQRAMIAAGFPRRRGPGRAPSGHDGGDIEGWPAKSIEERAKMAAVAESTQKRADAIYNYGDQQIIESVLKDRTTVNDAYKAIEEAIRALRATERAGKERAKHEKEAREAEERRARAQAERMEAEERASRESEAGKPAGGEKEQEAAGNQNPADSAEQEAAEKARRESEERDKAEEASRRAELAAEAEEKSRARAQGEAEVLAAAQEKMGNANAPQTLSKAVRNERKKRNGNGNGSATAVESGTESRTRPADGSRANLLDGGEWLKNSISIWRAPKTGEDRGNGHPATFPMGLVRRILDCYTNGVEITVIDPFAGSGTTLAAACERGYNAVGIEIYPERAEEIEQRMARFPAAKWRVIEGDARRSHELAGEAVADLMVTSPPYWNILNRERTADLREKRNYGSESADIGNIGSYGEYVRNLLGVMESAGKTLREGAYAFINVMDLRVKDKLYPLHSDLYNALEGAGYALDDIVIWDRQSEYSNLRPLGYPNRFRINRVHEYLLVMRRAGANGRVPSQDGDGEETHPSDGGRVLERA